ncbi:MAG: malto-oligosyltrehalose synthase [Candidatus Margulisiibacteriota bacterium]
MRVPQAVYRLQFNQDFDFRQAEGMVGYLKELGVSDIYASPIFKARAGSSHGYDVVDLNTINPELGGEQAFDSLIGKVKENGLFWIQDVISNHMAYDRQNLMLMNVLENGRSSKYAGFFDIEWDHLYENLKGQLLAPFLGKFYAECLKDGEIKLVREGERITLNYFEHKFPLNKNSYSRFFPDTETAIARYNSNPDLMDELLKEQFFRISFWKVACEEINYRRFFNINDLISLSVEDEHVFNETHELIKRLVAEKKFDGLRVDHIDGLYDPKTYLERLRQFSKSAYIVVEKILAAQESLPSEWPVQGTTGYDFLNHLNGVFCRTDRQKEFARIYYRFTGLTVSFDDLNAYKKRQVIGKHMAGDIDNLAHMIKRMAGGDRYGRDITLYGLRRALVEVMVYFPVYRTYISADLFSESDRAYLKAAFDKAREKSPGLSYELDFIEKFFFINGFSEKLTEEEKKNALRFMMRFQQFTGPLMAKGFEDSVLYAYNKLISLNEVGGDPSRFGVKAKEFHEFNKKRARQFKHSLNETATHDTKRGEDVRARINVLSEMPKEWKNNLKAWSRLNKAKKKNVNGRHMPDENDEYFIYQTLLGSMPFDQVITRDYRDRIKAYMIKAVREAKRHTAWIKPDIEYEDACLAFIDRLFEDQFLDKFLPFQKKIAFYGIYNSLSQALIKMTAPGVPGFYQGAELWDLNLVDPDNRRPVDFESRKRLLKEIKESQIKDLLATKEDGRVKMFLIWRVLAVRNAMPDLFASGGYRPLRAEGKHKDRVVAFARQRGDQKAVVIAPRFLTGVLGEAGFSWQDTVLKLPGDWPRKWRNAITGQDIDDTLIDKVLKDFPAALLVS